MIIDAHVHITEDGKWFNSGLSASVDTLLAAMDLAGIDKAVLVPVPGIVSNKYIAKIYHEHEDRLIGFGSIDSLLLKASERDLLSSIEMIKEYGLCGVKLHPRLQKFDLEELKNSNVPGVLSEHQLTLMICGWLQSSSIDIHRLLPLKIDEIAKQNSRLQIILTHMGGHRFWDAFFVARANPNVYLDCSYFIKFFQGTSLEMDFRASLNKIDQKVIYGSDFPEVSLKESISIFSGYNWGSEVDTDAVLGNNILKLLRKNESAG